MTEAHSFLDPTQLWDDYRPTPLIELPALARRANVGRVFVKVEGDRPLGNFKVLGGMLAGLRALARATGATSVQALRKHPPAALPRLICASDGNHGLAVAAAAARAGTTASIYLPGDVSDARARRIEAFNATVVRINGTYDDAVNAAADAAMRCDGLLVPDTTADPHDPVVRDVMAGYALLARELVHQFRHEARTHPSHLIVQAGVGGLAAAMTDGLRNLMRAGRTLIVEPEHVACVARALAAGHPVRIAGDLQTSASMLSCGLASAPAVEVLQRHDVRGVLVSEAQLQTAPQALREAGGPESTPSGAAGVAGLLRAATNPVLRAVHQLDTDSCVLLIATEGLVRE